MIIGIVLESVSGGGAAVRCRPAHSWPARGAVERRRRRSAQPLSGAGADRMFDKSNQPDELIDDCSNMEFRAADVSNRSIRREQQRRQLAAVVNEMVIG
jgi:hypothetical protein